LKIISIRLRSFAQMSSAGPEIQQHFMTAHPGGAISSLIKGGPSVITREQASSIPSDEVQALAPILFT
jgi:hypothetical protein